MSEYMDLVRKEAVAYLEEYHPKFLEDEGEFGAKSSNANLLRWIDHHGTLAVRLQEISKNWGLKECNWVAANTRNKSKEGGDTHGRAFESFIQDIRHAIKKKTKK